MCQFPHFKNENTSIPILTRITWHTVSSICIVVDIIVILMIIIYCYLHLRSAPEVCLYNRGILAQITGKGGGQHYVNGGQGKTVFL